MKVFCHRLDLASQKRSRGWNKASQEAHIHYSGNTTSTLLYYVTSCDAGGSGCIWRCAIYALIHTPFKTQKVKTHSVAIESFLFQYKSTNWNFFMIFVEEKALTYLL